MMTETDVLNIIREEHNAQGLLLPHGLTRHSIGFERTVWTRIAARICNEAEADKRRAIITATNRGRITPPRNDPPEAA